MNANLPLGFSTLDNAPVDVAAQAPKLHSGACAHRMRLLVASLRIHVVRITILVLENTAFC
jgi:hypothetical protein